MSNRIRAAIAAAVAVPALAVGAVLASTPSSPTMASSPVGIPVTSLGVHQIDLADFTGGTQEDNVKIESGGDDGCLTYAHPVLSTPLGIVPCDGSHNFDVVISPDGHQEVWKLHGTDLAIGDQSGEITSKAFNKTSDSLFSPSGFAGCQITKTIGNQQVTFLSIAFEESMPNDVWIEASSGSVVALHSCNVHTTWAVVSG